MIEIESILMLRKKEVLSDFIAFFHLSNKMSFFCDMTWLYLIQVQKYHKG